MTQDRKYNGWTNWETWNCNLHFDDSFSEQAQECWNDAEEDKTFSREENAALVLKDVIEESVREYVDNSIEGLLSNGGIIQDMISGYLSEVNFYEIARAYVAEVDKDGE